MSPMCAKSSSPGLSAVDGWSGLCTAHTHNACHSRTAEGSQRTARFWTINATPTHKHPLTVPALLCLLQPKYVRVLASPCEQ